MKKNIKNLSIILFFLLIMILIFVNRLLITNTVIYSSNLFLTRVFPTLFIMFILQDILINYNFEIYLFKIFGSIFDKIFKLSKYGTLIVILSLVGGTPSSSYMINNLFTSNKISKQEANHLLSFTYFTNPLFLYNMLMLIFSNNYITFKIIITIYISNFILLFLTRKKHLIITDNYIKNNIVFGDLLINSIKKNMNIMLMILGTITTFLILSNILTMYIKIESINIFLKGILEITGGLESIIRSSYKTNIKEIITTLIISFGGVSIHAQVYGTIYESKLSYFYFLKGRLLCMIISLTIILFV